MKKHLLLTTIIVMVTIQAIAEEFSVKYGKITLDELNMSTCSQDSSAVAEILYTNSNSYYDLTTQQLRVVTEISRKIKIFKQGGADFGSVSIPYYYGSGVRKDIITGLEATAYNLEKGKITKTKLEKKYIFDEMIDTNHRQLKFSIPGIKEGSVIEYKYKISKYNPILSNQQMQYDIPVKAAKVEVKIPDYFLYNIEIKGYEKIIVDEKIENQTFLVDAGKTIEPITCSARNIVYSINDVPALKNEPYVWNMNDYRASIIFELKGTSFPMQMQQTFSTTWKDIEKSLKEESDFSSNINKSSTYSSEIKPLIANLTTDQEKINFIFTWIKKKIKWNGEYSLFNNEPREAQEKGTGNNAQINSILISTLKSLGFTAYPILMSQRSAGRLSYIHPSLDGLSTFIVGIDGINNPDEKFYLDGSSDFGGVNILPTDLLVDRAYIMNPNASEKWVNLTTLTKNKILCILNASIDHNGDLVGTIDRYFTNTDAFYFRENLHNHKDSISYINKLETNFDIKLDSMKLDGENPTETTLKQHLCFTKKYDTGGDFLYISSILFPHLTENKFTASERKLPIEFAYPHSYQFVASIKIPQNYTVSELPKQLQIILQTPDQGKCLYKVDHVNNEIKILYKFDLNKILFSYSDYPAIRDFWGHIVNKNNEMIVLKKSTAPAANN